MGNFNLTEGKSVKNRSTEIKVRSFVKEAMIYAQTLDGAYNSINSDIRRAKPINHFVLADLYRIGFTTDHKALELWHLNPNSSQKDRLLLTITLSQ